MKTVQIDNDVTLIYKSIPPLAVAAIQNNYTKKHPKPKVPTYEVQAVGGVVVHHEHDETTISDKDGTKAEWEKYVVERNTWQTGLTERLMMLFLTQGMDLKTSNKKKKQWDKQLSFMFDIEDLEEDDLKLLYLQTFVLNTQEKFAEATKIVMGLTGVSEEALANAESLF